jgi:UDP-glucose 4-epimerase
MTAPVVWVTGAHGFIGRHVGLAAHRAGALVAGIGHGGWSLPDRRQWGLDEWLNGEVTSNNLRELRIRSGAPSVIIHLAGGSSVGAAISNPREDFVRTVASTTDLLDWVRQDCADAAVIVASSAAVYGSAYSEPISEDRPTIPYSPFGHHKLMMELLCRCYAATYGVRSVIARLFSVYGAGLKKQLLWDLCTRIESGSSEITLGGTGAELRDWVHVSDVANVLLATPAFASADVPTVNVGTGCGTPVREIARLVIEAWAQSGSPSASAVAFSGAQRPGDPPALVADPDRLLGRGLSCPTPLAQGLAEYVAWFRNARPPARY